MLRVARHTRIVFFGSFIGMVAARTRRAAAAETFRFRSARAACIPNTNEI